MASNDLEKRYDVVITGTDLTSSLVAAAVARIGKTVLHLDPYDRYGQEWSAMRLFDVLAARVLLVKPSMPEEVAIPPGSLQCLPPSLISNVHLETNVFDDVQSCSTFIKEFSRNEIAEEVLDRFRNEYYPQLMAATTAAEAKNILGKIKDECSPLNALDNAFSVDLTPRFIFSLGPMVDILIRSNVTRYLEFRKIARILTPLVQDQNQDAVPTAAFKLINVPCTRNDVFKSTTITMVEKRLLMRFLDFIKSASKSPPEEYATKTFAQTLTEQQLTPKLRALIVNSVLMDSDQISTADALSRINRFMSAIGRFADRPYLIPTYGTDDLVQAFCRYAAIYGATYCLSSSISAVEVCEASGKVTQVKLGNSTIECDHVVTNYRFPGREAAAQEVLKPKKPSLSRAIICSRQSICAEDLSEFDNTSVLYLPPGLVPSSSNVPVYVFETDKSTNACPKGLYIQYFWCDATAESAVQDLKPIVEAIYASAMDDSTSQQPLWSLYFNQATEGAGSSGSSSSIAPNLHHISPPINELDFDFIVQEARKIFEAMYPEEVFFPTTQEPSSVEVKEEDEEEEVVEEQADPVDEATMPAEASPESQ